MVIFMTETFLCVDNVPGQTKKRLGRL